MIIFLLFNLVFYACGLIVISYSEIDHKKTIFRIYSISTLLFTSLFFYLLWTIKNL
jgi:hypothetical protein